MLQFAGPMRTPVVDHGLPEGHWGIDFIDNCRREMMVGGVDVGDPRQVGM